VSRGRGHHLADFAVELLGQHLDDTVGRPRARPTGERALADAPRDEGAEREDQQRRDGFAAEAN
jgi:hypothetical protein